MGAQQTHLAPDVLLLPQAQTLRGRRCGLEGCWGSFPSLVPHGATEVLPPRTRSFAKWGVYLLLNFSTL